MKANTNIKSKFNLAFCEPVRMPGKQLVVSAQLYSRKRALALFQMVSNKDIKLNHVHHSRVRFYMSWNKKTRTNDHAWHLHDYAIRSCPVWYCLEGTLPKKGLFKRISEWFVGKPSVEGHYGN